MKTNMSEEVERLLNTKGFSYAQYSNAVRALSDMDLALLFDKMQLKSVFDASLYGYYKIVEEETERRTS